MQAGRVRSAFYYALAKGPVPAPGAASGPAAAPGLLQSSAPGTRRAWPTACPHGNGTGLPPGFFQAGGSTMARLPWAPRAPWSDAGVGTGTPEPPCPQWV